MKSLHLRWNRMYPYILWFYIIVNTTFYFFNNQTDNLIQIICLLFFFFIAVNRVYKSKHVAIPKNLLICILFIILGIIPDIVNRRYIGLRVSAMYAVPVMVFLAFHQIYRFQSLNKSVFLIPKIYGIYIASSAVLLELGLFLQLPLAKGRFFIEKTGNEVDLSRFFLGAYASWGSLFGRTLYRMQAYYIEPSKFGAFLLFPFFLFLSDWKRKKSFKSFISFLLVSLAIILSMSRAAWIALIAAVCLPFVYQFTAQRNGILKPVSKEDLLRTIGLAFILILSIISMFAMLKILAGIFPNIEAFRTGITNQNGQYQLVRVETVDSNVILSTIFKHPFGVGFSHVLHGVYDFDANLANALMLWFVVAGFPGLILALYMQSYLFFFYAIPLLRSKDTFHVALAQIYFALTLHGFSYGSWLTPDYLFICMAIIYTYHQGKENTKKVRKECFVEIKR